MSAELLPAIILAGGLATRLQPLTEAIPKALVEVNGEPFIAHQLRLLQAQGVTRVLLCVGHLGEMIQEYIGDGTRFAIRVEFAFDGPHLLGTAGAIKQALTHLPLGEAYFVLYGDSYLPCDYRSVQNVFLQRGKMALMTVFHNRDQWDMSNVEYQDGQIVRYDKHQRTTRMHYIDYGLGVFTTAAFALVPESQPYDLALLYQDLLSRGQLAACEVSERFYEIGSLAGLEETRRYLALRNRPV